MLRSPDQQNGRRIKAPSRSNVVADDLPEKLRALIQRVESRSNSSLLTARNREQRLVKMRAEIAKLANKEARAFCNCNQITVAYGRAPEDFEAEMKRVCPVHERRKLGVIVLAMCVPHRASELRLLELLDSYARSLLEFGG